MTRVWARMILLVCLALTLGPASAVGATGRLSLTAPPWLVGTSARTSAGAQTLPHTGADLSRLVFTGVVLIGFGALLRAGASDARE